MPRLMRTAFTNATWLLMLLCATPVGCQFVDDVGTHIVSMISEQEGWSWPDTEQKRRSGHPNPFWASANVKGEGRQLQAPSSSPQATCAWQAYVTGRKFNVAYPDMYAVYQVLVKPNLGLNEMVRIKGTFPKCRYFSIQSNNPKVGMPMTTLRDYEVTADAGSVNPFADPTATDGGQGTYTIHLSARKNPKLANSLNLCPDGMSDKECKGQPAVVIMRLYFGDPAAPEHDCMADPPDSTRIPRLWGYVPAPKVATTDLVKGVNKKTGQLKWRPVNICDPTRPTYISNAFGGYMEKLIPPFPSPKGDNMKDNFKMYMGMETSGAGVYPNLDATYLVATGYQDGLPAERKNERVIAKIRGTWPTTAKTWKRSDGPRVPDWQDYDVRYASMSTIAKITSGPTVDGINDSEMEYLYRNNEAFKANRTYSIVVAQDRASTCGLYSATEDLFLTTTYNGTAQGHFSLLFRQLISKYQRDQVPDKSIGYAKISCSAGDKKQCENPKTLRSTMLDHYPSVDWYTCLDGVLRPLSTATLESTFETAK